MQFASSSLKEHRDLGHEVDKILEINAFHMSWLMEVFRSVYI